MIRFLEDRLGIVSAFRSSMSEKRPPKGIGFLRTIGFAALTVMILQFLSGIALAFHYVPTSELAYDSIRAMEQDIIYGAFVRSLHHFGASAFVIFVGLHMARVFFTGAYKRPREFTWVTGVGLFLIVMGFGFTGYLLPWDQKAYFATKVGTEIAADTPIIGNEIRTFLRGGEDVGQPTLTRFYIIHVVLLPLALLLVLGLHFYLIQRHGVAPPGLAVDDEGEKGDPYFPHHTFKEALVGVLVAGALFALSAAFRAPLEALAEPSDTSYTPRPDWYFLGLFELLKLFKTNQTIGTFWIPAIFVGCLFILPFVDRGRHRHWIKRWFMTPVGILVCAAILGLTVAGWVDDPDAKEDGEKRGETLPFPLGYTNFERRGYLLTRRLGCTECHKFVVKTDDSEITYGGENELAETTAHLNELEVETISDVVAQLEAPDSEDMPAFTNVSKEDRLAIGAFIVRFVQDNAR